MATVGVKVLRKTTEIKLVRSNDILMANERKLLLGKYHTVNLIHDCLQVMLAAVFPLSRATRQPIKNTAQH